MKIGEAGEAFFVFETDDDVPPDLITSPILQPIRPEEEAAPVQTDPPTNQFGAKIDLPSDDTNTPDFLDLNAGNGEARRGRGDEEPCRDVNLTPKQQFHKPTFLRHSASRNTIQQQRRSVEEPSKSTLGLPSPPASRSPTPEMEEQDKRVDEALKCLTEGAKPPEVKYHHGK